MTGGTGRQTDARPGVLVEGPEGQVWLGDGDLIGRGPVARLRIPTPCVAEAHAVVLLRGRCPALLALRGGLEVDGARPAEIVLKPGLEIRLSHAVTVRVLDVREAAETPALWVDGRAQPLDDVLRLPSDGASGVTVFGDGEKWYALTDLQELPTVLEVGRETEVGGRRLRLGTILTETALHEAPVCASVPLLLEIEDDGVRVRQGALEVWCGGVGGRLLRELAEFEVPVEWRVVAGQLWPDAAPDTRTRARLDMALTRLRRKLQDAGLRRELVVATGGGHLMLSLDPRDEVVMAAEP